MKHDMNDESKQLSQYANRITPAILEVDAEHFFAMHTAFLAFAPQLHIDVCDGSFVPSMTVPFEAPEIMSASFFDRLQLKQIETEVHLMVQYPHQIGCDFIRHGAKRIVVQWESCPNETDLTNAVDLWDSRGATVSLSVLIPSDLEQVMTYVSRERRIVAVQLMSIDPIGAQGRPFDTRVLERIRTIRRAFPAIEISIDGSMNEKTIPSIFHAGASRAVVGSAVAKQSNPADAYESLCIRVEKAMKT
jgi:ribulose-phosphate 3-epimerase